MTSGAEYVDSTTFFGVARGGRVAVTAHHGMALGVGEFAYRQVVEERAITGGHGMPPSERTMVPVV